MILISYQVHTGINRAIDLFLPLWEITETQSHGCGQKSGKK